MKTNLGSADKIVRILIAAVVAALYFTHVITGTLGLILLALGGILLATALVSFCPLYYMLGINSCPRKA